MLNNKGYGLKEIMFFLCVMFVAILVTMFVYNKNFKNLFEGENLSDKDYNYQNVEEELESSAKEYYSKTFSAEEASSIPMMIVTSKTLKEKNYLSSFDENCTGYVIVKNEKKVSYEPYIKCDNYKTDGYSESLNK